MGQQVVIVGGGMVGSFVALHLARAGRGFQVTVIEPDPTYRSSSTARSASAIRQQFNLGVNVALSRDSFAFLGDLSAHLSVAGERVDIDFVERGYLVLAAPDGVERLRASHRTQRAHGADVSFLEAPELERRMPWLKLDGVGAACLGESGEGWFDPMKLLRAVRRKAEALGVVYRPSRLAGWRLAGGRLSAVVLEGGTTVAGDAFVNAAGAQAGRVVRPLGIDLPVESRKRTAFVFGAPDGPASLPCLVDPTFGDRGVFARPYEGDFLAVTSPEPGRDPDTDDLAPDEDLFEQVVRPALARRVRGFEQVSLVRSWAGHYEMNVFDQNAIVGPHPALSNLVFACGFSGHGIMHAPAVGRAVAEWLSFGEYRSLDLAPLSFARLARGERLDDVQASEHRGPAAGEGQPRSPTNATASTSRARP